jgi:hypothetical protein
MDSLRLSGKLYFMKKTYTLLLLAVAVIGVIGYRTHLAIEGANARFNTEVHVHADFAVYMNGTKLDFTKTEYQSSVGHEKDEHVHLHDGKGNIIHRHEEGVTLPEFFTSIGYQLTKDCFTTDTGTQYCTNASSSLALYVNEKKVDDILAYIPQEEDRVLLTYGASDQNLAAELASVSDEACIQSGTCPERGIATQESCGLTCDVTLAQGKITLKEIVTFVFLNHY